MAKPEILETCILCDALLDMQRDGGRKFEYCDLNKYIRNQTNTNHEIKQCLC